MNFLLTHGPAILFYVFATVAVLGALGVVTLKNPMYGAVSLLTTFLSVAALFILQHAEFLAAVQIFVYGGGILVLFLFVIMLMNLQRLPSEERYVPGAPFALAVVVLLGILLGVLLASAQFIGSGADGTALRSVEGQVVGNTEAVANMLYRSYLLPFEIASVFLLVAMIGAVVLARKD